MRHILFISVVGLSLVSIGCGGERAGAGGPAGGFERPPTPVEIAAATRGRIVDRFEAVGTIEAAEAVTVVSEIPGIVISLPFEEGSNVQLGDVLAQLEDGELRAALVRAEAVRDQRRASHERIRQVVARGAGTPQDLDDAAAELKVAEADVALARARLAKTRILAPFAGTVGARLVSPGAFLQAGTPITELLAIRDIKIKFTAPERYVPRFARGVKVEIATPAYPGETLDGTIAMIDPGLDPETRSAEVTARAANPENRFRPGMSADVSTVFADRPEAITIPNEAVFAEGDQTLVYVVQADSTVARKPVTLGTRLADVVEVVAGIEPGAQIVRAGHQKLYEGARIFPVSSRAEGGNAAGGNKP